MNCALYQNLLKWFRVFFENKKERKNENLLEFIKNYFRWYLLIGHSSTEYI